MPARKSPKKKVVLVLSAPQASHVQVAGDFTHWQQSPIDMKKLRNGDWKTTLSLEPGRYEYRLIVDGEWQDDPLCQLRAPNDFGSENCVIIVV